MQGTAMSDGFGSRPRCQGASRRGPRCCPNPEGPSPRLTRFLGILDLHGDGLTEEGLPRVQRSEGSGGDSGGGRAAPRPGGFLPLGRAGGAGLGRGSAPEVRPSLGGGPPPLRGAAGPRELGKATGLAAPGPPSRSCSKQKAGVPEPPPPH